jgi:type IV pilus assembly protein PilA
LTTAPKTSGLAIAALVFAVLFCIPGAPLVGLVLGIIAISKIDNSRGQLTGKGLAIAAIATSVVMMVANVGMLAAIAIPNFIRYQLRSKTSEARVNLQAIGNGAMAYFAEKNRFPEQSTDWVPASCPPSVKCPHEPEVWSKAPWTDLGFSPDRPHYYQLRYSSEGTTFTAEAQADLDGNGEFGHFKITGTVSADGRPQMDHVVDVSGGEF